MNRFSKHLDILGAVTSCCICVLSFLPCRGEDKPVPATNNSTTAIPATAQIGNVRVGVTTMEQLELMFGKGRAFTGGHPHGAREWYSKKAGWYIYADGFECNDAKQRIVDSFAISAVRRKVGAFDDRDFKIHRTSVDEKHLMILGEIKIGMEQKKVIAVLASKGMKPIVTDNLITWAEKGCDHIRDATRNHDQLTFDTWNAKLTFRNQKLQEIDLDCH